MFILGQGFYTIPKRPRMDSGFLSLYPVAFLTHV